MINEIYKESLNQQKRFLCKQLDKIEFIVERGVATWDDHTEIAKIKRKIAEIDYQLDGRCRLV